MNVGKRVLGSTSTHECGSTGTRVGVLVLKSTSTHKCGSTSTRVGVLVLFTYFWPTLKYLLSWCGQRHSDSWENSLLSFLENNHRNKVFLDRTGVIIRTNAIGAFSNSVLIITLAYQYASYYRGVLVRYCHETIGLLVRLYVLQRRVITKVWILWLLLWRTSMLVFTRAH